MSLLGFNVTLVLFLSGVCFMFVSYYVVLFLWSLTGVEDSSVHPALTEAHGDPGAGVLLQDAHAAGPAGRGCAHAVVITPVPDQHAIIVQRVDLKDAQVFMSVKAAF